MKITSLEIWEIGNSLMPYDHPIIIRVNTDEGISGLGEVGLAYGTGHSGGAGYVKNLAENIVKPENKRINECVNRRPDEHKMFACLPDTMRVAVDLIFPPGALIKKAINILVFYCFSLRLCIYGRNYFFEVNPAGS